MADNAVNRPGFQSSETSSAEVILYSQGNDPIVIGSAGVQPLHGRYRTDKQHALIGVSTQKQLTQSGSFTLTIKPARGISSRLLDQVVDDDWVDVVFRRHGRQWHTMRGTIDSISRTRAVGGSGATSYVYQITGRDHQKQFEITPIWFNRFTQENVAGSAGYRVQSILPSIGGDPAETVQTFLISWLQEFENIGRANWPIPRDLPNTSGNFITDIQRGFSLEGFTNVPSRISINPNFLEPSGTIWGLATEWSDPAFCELWCDLGKGGALMPAGEECTVDESSMSVFFRDRPFPLSRAVVDAQGNNPTGIGLGRDSAWFKLPLHIVNRQQIITDTVQRSGLERLNAFFVSPQITQELARVGAGDLLQPLWNADDIYRHGMRRYDIMSRYKSPTADLLTLTTVQRHMIRDWYAINPYLLSGEFALGVGRPEIRVGSRIRIPGDSGETQFDETYYVEAVAHNWTYGQGIKTSLSVTRGWVGDDDSLMDAIETLADNYSEPQKTPAREATTGAV